MTELNLLKEAVKVIEFYGLSTNWDWQDTPAGDGEYVPAVHDAGGKARNFLSRLPCKEGEKICTGYRSIYRREKKK